MHIHTYTRTYVYLSSDCWLIATSPARTYPIPRLFRAHFAPPPLPGKTPIVACSGDSFAQ